MNKDTFNLAEGSEPTPPLVAIFAAQSLKKPAAESPLKELQFSERFDQLLGELDTFKKFKSVLFGKIGGLSSRDQIVVGTFVGMLLATNELIQKKYESWVENNIMAGFKAKNFFKDMLELEAKYEESLEARAKGSFRIKFKNTIRKIHEKDSDGSLWQDDYSHITTLKDAFEAWLSKNKVWFRSEGKPFQKIVAKYIKKSKGEDAPTPKDLKNCMKQIEDYMDFVAYFDSLQVTYRKNNGYDYTVFDGLDISVIAYDKLKDFVEFMRTIDSKASSRSE